MEKTWILLHDVEGPVNLGSVCRAMANTGFANLRFTGPLDQTDFEARKFAVHARPLLERAEKREAIQDLMEGLDVVFGFSPRDPLTDGSALSLDQFHQAFAEARGRKIGLLFGNEASGLSNEHLALCRYRVALPAQAAYVSMNLAQAVLVVLWEVSRKQTGPAPEPPSPDMAEPGEKMALLNNLRGFLDGLEFLNPQNPEHLWKEILPIFNRRDWTKREVNLLQAIFGKSRSRHLAVKKKLENALKSP